jgi:hypothetical protein
MTASPRCWSPPGLDLVEDVDRTGQLENDQHDKDNADNFQNSAGRHRIDVLIQPAQLFIGERGNPLPDVCGVNAECDELGLYAIPRDEILDLGSRFIRLLAKATDAYVRKNCNASLQAMALTGRT